MSTRGDDPRDHPEELVEADALPDSATQIHPDDPLLDTAVRRIAAEVTEDQPYGKPGPKMDRRSPFRIGFHGAMGAGFALLLVYSVVQARSVLVLLLVSAFLAIGLDPAVHWLEQHGVRRGRAVGIVLLGVLLFFALFLLAIVPPIIDQVQQFQDAAPGYVHDLRGNSRVISLDKKFHFLGKLTSYANDPGQYAPQLFGGVVGVGKVVFSAFFSSLTVLILTLYFLSSLPSMKASAYRMVPRSRRARVGLLTDEILSRVGGYVAGALTIAAIAGVTTFVFCLALGIPYPVALAMLVAVTDVIPLIGATIGAGIVVAVAFSLSVPVGLTALGYYVVYQQVENYVLYPRIMKRSVDVSPAATVVAVLVGGSLMGVLGALLAIPMAAAVQLVLQEVVAPRQDEL